MSLLGFKKRFAGPVEQRTKRQTIRAKCQGHQVGRAIQLYTGLRTKGCRKLAAEDPICISIEAIRIVQPVGGWSGRLIIEGRLLDLPEIDHMAKLDGFDSKPAFFAFFGKPDGPSFDGFLIRWDWP